jgi:hypothetical protein
VLPSVTTTFDVHVPQALSPRLTILSLALLPIGAVPNVIPIFNFGDRYRELRLRSLTRQPPPLPPPLNSPSLTCALRDQRIETAIMSFRPGSRIFSSFRPFFRPAQANGRRQATTAAGPGGFAGFWNSPIGPKTVHFWYVLHRHLCAMRLHFRLPGSNTTNRYTNTSTGLQ